MNRIAQIISSVFNPLVVVVLMSFLLGGIKFGLITILAVAILSIIIIYLVKKKVFINFDVSKQEQRPLLYFLEFSTTLIYLSVIYYLHAPIILIAQTLAVLLVLLALSLVNKFTKASGHIAILSAAVTMLIFIYGIVFILGFLVIGLVSWSRLELERHLLKEVIVGLIIGVSVASLVAII